MASLESVTRPPCSQKSARLAKSDAIRDPLGAANDYGQVAPACGVTVTVRSKSPSAPRM
jgi:hypothetical protein